MLYLNGERGAENELVKLENENWEQNLTQYDTSHSKKLIVSKLHLEKRYQNWPFCSPVSATPMWSVRRKPQWRRRTLVVLYFSPLYKKRPNLSIRCQSNREISPLAASF